MASITVVPAKAGTHFDFRLNRAARRESQNGFRLSPEWRVWGVSARGQGAELPAWTAVRPWLPRAG